MRNISYVCIYIPSSRAKISTLYPSLPSKNITFLSHANHHLRFCSPAIMLPQKRPPPLRVDDKILSNKRFSTSFYRPADEDLHGHQLAIYGLDGMIQMFGSNILISGMQGLGVEIAKNLILAGVNSVTLHDESNVELWDLSSSFIFSEEDLGNNRAIASVPKLQRLNRAVIVAVLITPLAKEDLSDFQAVVFTNISLEKAIEFDDYCHQFQPPIAFIKSEVRGLFGSVFCDFGPEFTVLDLNGVDAHRGIISYITNENPALVVCLAFEELEFQVGDLVVFSGVRGMGGLNDGKPRKIKVMHPSSFIIEEDTTRYDVLGTNGIVTKVESKVLNFKPLQQALKDPGDFLLSDISKFDRPPLHHLAFQALDKFIAELGRFPVAGSEEDATKIIFLLIDINSEQSHNSRLENFDFKLLRNFADGARAVLNPMATMFGGIVGQEVLKACSGMYHPIFQFFYFDSVESLPSYSLNPEDLKPLNSRYDAQISVFGSMLQKKLEEAKVFIVGSGRLGCEFLKNIALMGVCCGESGKLTITDDDFIEKSNLCRQFMFRDQDIGQAKSTVAVSAASSINPHLHVEALQTRACPDTDNVLDDTFWEMLTVIIDALDNVNDKYYIDQRCLYYRKPLLESGTLGSKCNTQMVIPGLTENYGASMDPLAKQAPMRTVYLFPFNIDHCVTWARSEFDSLLEKTPKEVNAYLRYPSEYIAARRNDVQAKDTLERILECLDKDRCHTFQDCITWARLKFEDYFANQINQLTNIYPEDAVTSSGTPFWSPPKRFPRPLQFSCDYLTHTDFVMTASILRAETFGIPIPDWVGSESPEKLIEAVNNVLVPEYSPPREVVEIVRDEDVINLLITASIEDDATVINELVMKLDMCRSNLPPDYRMNPIQFNEDDVTNYHMELITSVANLRARNYGISEVDLLRNKFNIGRIIPVFDTCTPIASGLVCLELYKVLDGKHKLEDYRNTFVNLAVPSLSIVQPVRPPVGMHRDQMWSIWTRWPVRGNPTLRMLLQRFSMIELNVYSIAFGRRLIYSRMITKHRELMNRRIVDLVKEVAPDLHPDKCYVDVVVCCEDKDFNDIDIPLLSIYLK